MKDQTTIPSLRSSAIKFLKFGGRCNNDTGSHRRQILSGERKHGKNQAFAKVCRGKQPSHLLSEANCLRLFLAHV